MTWRVVYASEVGTSHEFGGTPCQDSCWAQVDALSDGQPVLSLFVADGAGSALHGGEGAELAIEAAAAFLGEKLNQGEFGLNDLLATELLLAVRDRLHTRAAALSLKARDFACTFIGVLSSTTGTLVLQVGDGGVVVDVGAELEVAVAPMAGEYVNMTRFVTDEDAVSAMISKTYPDRALRVAAFTDGIQRLALNLANNTPHAPFFTPFFSSMAKASAEQEELLQDLLKKFLGSPAVNERTDDDKTLALAVWVG